MKHDPQQEIKMKIFEASMNVGFFSILFQTAPRKTKSENDLSFVLKEEGKTSFDYEIDNAKETSRVYLVDDSIYIRLNGVYYSYDGLTFKSWEFVQPVQVSKIEYQKIN